MNKTKLDLISLSLSSPITMSTENINFFVGLPLNICVVIFLTRDRGLDGSLIFTLNQIAAEILFAFPAPLFVLCFVNVEHLCFLSPIEFIITTCITSRFLFQCCVCFERYVAVVHPVTFLKYKTMKNRLITSGIIWMYSFISCIVATFNYSQLPLSVFAILYSMILSVMVFCSLSLLRGLRRPGPGVRDDVNVAKIRAFKVVSINLLIFLIQTIPVMVSFIINYTLSDYAFTLAFTVAINVAIAISLLHPVLFLYQNGKLTCMK